MSDPIPSISEDQVLAPPHPEPPVPLAPPGCDDDWKACLDAGHDQGPTSTHPDTGWRSIDTAKP